MVRWSEAFRPIEGGRALSCPRPSRARIGQRMLSVLLVLSLGMVPVLHGLHLWLAPHVHRYCFEHGQIEDLLRARPKMAARETRSSQAKEDAAAYAPAPSPAASSSHIACTVLNSASVTAAFDQPTTSGQPEQRPQLAARPHCGQDWVLQRSLILLAPKRSPPRLFG